MGFSAGYRLLYLLHIASFVVAFAPVVVAVLPGGKNTSSAALSAAGRVVYAPALVATGLFGVLCVVTSDDTWEFSQGWISLAFAVWIAMNGVLHAMVLAGRRTGNDPLTERGEQILTGLFLVMLYLMIWKPGQ